MDTVLFKAKVGLGQRVGRFHWKKRGRLDGVVQGYGVSKGLGAHHLGCAQLPKQSVEARGLVSLHHKRVAFSNSATSELLF